ncbi:MAG: transcription termination/antitermination protein NusG [Thermoguttaceae bacterium]
MPILPPEPDIFPEDLLNDGQSEGGCRHQWWALYTLARREKELMRRLRGLAIPHYGPLIKRASVSPSGRVRTSYVPLFPSYVFLMGDDAARYQAMRTNCVSRWLAVEDTEQLVHDLRQIRRLILSDTPLTPEARIQPGMRVRIRGGALAGLEGTVIRRRGEDRLLVVVTFIQRGASIQLRDFQVERID